MGKVSPKKPIRLAEKLLKIREGLGLRQGEIINALGLNDELTQSQISAFERGSRTPSLLVVLQYARLIGVGMDVLVDDGLELPHK